MKATARLFIIYCIFISYGLAMKFNIQAKSSIFEDDESSISYRTTGVDNKKTFTLIKPDETSSPLKLSKEQIGRFSWAVLHSIAASYPKKPNNDEKQNIVTLLHSFAKMFPCKICSSHFQKMLADYPIKNNSREELVYYLCDLHNKVNIRLNKPIFDCKKAFGFWGGECGCSEKKVNEIQSTNSTVVSNGNRKEEIKEIKIENRNMTVFANSTQNISSSRIENKTK